MNNYNDPNILELALLLKKIADIKKEAAVECEKFKNINENNITVQDLQNYADYKKRIDDKFKDLEKEFCS
jgi:hypothetical protein